VAGDLLASSVQCDTRSLAKSLLLGTFAECSQNVMESVTPEHSLPGTALTTLHLTLSDLTLQLLAPPQMSHPLLCGGPGTSDPAHTSTSAPALGWLLPDTERTSTA